jgi:predicted KAP-like P-loop ATPase
MPSSTTINDRSIQSPEEDRYGLDPFARSLAISITKMVAPEGVVFAINGPWGSGKSGVINLVVHHVKPKVEENRLQVVRFSPWWLNGPEALTRAFFEALKTALDGALRGKVKKKAKQALAAVYQRITPANPFAAAAGDAATGQPIGTAAIAAIDVGMEWLNAKRPIEEEFERLAEVLREQEKRFLVIIDDIDRLDPEDAILVFRLVKSVGRLPNVIYLLAFHREIADRHLRRRFDSSATEYLEKIVQVSYELPVPTPEALLQALLAEIGNVLTLAEKPSATTRFGNLLHDCVAPWLRTPRDVVSLSNAISVGWPVVAGEVDPADFMALEALKLAHPQVYRAVQENPQALCGHGQRRTTADRHGNAAERYDAMLLVDVRDAERHALRIALRRLFPRLDSVWGNVHYGEDAERLWHRDRLVCARAHFDTYFRLAPGEGSIPAGELNAFISHLADRTYVHDTMLRALAIRRRIDGRSKASLLLDELAIYAPEIPESSIEGLVKSLFEIADDLDVREDEDRRFLHVANNQFRLHWLLNALVRDRMELPQRSTLLTTAAAGAQVSWLVSLAERCIQSIRRSDDSDSENQQDPLVNAEAAESLRNAALEAIRISARGGDLIGHRRLGELLHSWARLADDSGVQARRWTSVKLREDSAVIHLAAAFTSESQAAGIGTGSSLGDRVTTRAVRVNRDAIAAVCDVDRLLRRVEELRQRDIPQESRIILDRFIEGINRGPID